MKKVLSATATLSLMHNSLQITPHSMLPGQTIMLFCQQRSRGITTHRIFLRGAGPSQHARVSACLAMLQTECAPTARHEQSLLPCTLQ